MQKFSLYDILTVLFPGAILLLMLDSVRTLFALFPDYHLTNQWDVIVIMAVLFGAGVYVLNFTFISKSWAWLYKPFRLYADVTELYYQSTFPKAVADGLNRRGAEWYDKRLFPSKADYDALTKEEQATIVSLQDEFYDRMYYELDYDGKLDAAKTFQSFYLFFRSLFVAAAISIVALLLTGVVNLISGFTDITLCSFTVELGLFLLLGLFSVAVARWYRRRTVFKMYWYFYSHINSKNK